MQKQVGHDKDIIIEGGYKICYGKRRGGEHGWHCLGGGFTTNERVANRWAKALRKIVASNS